MIKKILLFVFAIYLLLPSQLGLSYEKPLSVHFIDVGQSDCILIQTPKNKNILIDAGRKEYSQKIIHYLRKHQVKVLDAVIATHPHGDHIGAMTDIIHTFPIRSFYMQDFDNYAKEIKKLLKQNNVKITKAKAGDKVKVEQGIKLKIIAPLSQKYTTLNEQSYAMKLIYGHRSFLLMGDAEEESETDLLMKKINIKADVIKIGHHGANTGTSLPFLKTVDPEYAILTVGYGGPLPNPNVIRRLRYLRIPTFRTDYLGTIVAKTNGDELWFDIRAKNQGNIFR